MMRKKVRVLLMTICLVMTMGLFSAVAEDGDGLLIYNTRLITSDKDATYIEGQVEEAVGQTLYVKVGLGLIAEKKMPNTGAPEKFKIKIPAKNISTGSVSIMYVLERLDGSSLSKPARVEVEYKERQKQQIKVAANEYSLTYPGLDIAPEAAATSGGKLIYSSNNPDVVTVDEDGNVTSTGGGDAEISIKQIGSSAYEEEEKTVKVSVEPIDAFTVTFHASAGDEDETFKQIIRTGETDSLSEIMFTNASHEFLGWAPSDDGYMEYLDAATVSDLAEKGGNVDLYAIWSGDGIRGALAWAVKIAADDSFSYGKKPQTSTCGCYFCGTNQRNKPKGYERTYVCMPFVTAAYGHGAEDPEMYALCEGGKRCLSLTESNLKYSCWTRVGSAGSLSVSDLQPGDVICKYSADNSSGHLSIYLGNGDIVDATSDGGNCWGPNSIAVRRGAAAGYLRRAAGASSKSYVMRYVGPSE